MDTTKESILSAATRLFAEKGFEGVTTREICRVAGVNGALVNYHFRTKEGLYQACLERVFRRADGHSVVNLVKTVTDEASWRAAIHEWVLRFSVAMNATQGEEGIVPRLYGREMRHPSCMHDFITDEFLEPIYNSLLALVRLAGRSESESRKWTTSIWFQLSAIAFMDESWRTSFRPRGLKSSSWGRNFADFVCERIFSELSYVGKGVSK